MKYLFSSILVVLSIALSAQQLAFPGAEGFGKYATGGRNGTVYHVTNLDDSGPGSFRDAVSQPNRIVVFDVGGVINIGDRIVINKNITVAGQTAPGGGITIYGNGVACNDNSGNSIIRHIRIRMGKNGDYRKDALGISAGTDYMFDHVSVSWGWDGTVDINGTGIDRLTFQDCIISQGIDIVGHSTGGLFESGSKSIIRTLWIDNETRNPKAKGPQEFINSVIYNWGGDGYIMGSTSSIISECNLMGSYFIAGPSSNAGNYVSNTTPEFHLYESDNWFDGDKDGVLDGRQLIAGDGDFKTATIMDNPFTHPGVNNVLSAQDALDHVINYAGASIVRDEVDLLLIDQLTSYGTKGSIIHDEDDNGIEGGVGTVDSGSRPTDSDNDGMPDEWEDANGLDKTTDDAMIIADNGYANIENYINSIVATLDFLAYPKNLAVTDITENSVSLQWVNNETEADNILIEYGTNQSSLSQSTSVAGDATSATITDLQSNTTYYFRAKAVNETAQSGYSSIVSGKTLEAPEPPVACVNPTPADGSSIGFTENIKLTWENFTSLMGGELKYTLYMGTSEESMEELAAGKIKSSFEAGNLQPGTTYYWRVKTTNSLGSDEGDIWSFTTMVGSRSMVLYFPFDETSGSTAENMAADNDASAKEFSPAWSEGIYNNALTFSASPTTSGMIVDHYEAISMDISPFTISLWFKSDGGGISDTYLFHKGTHSAEYGDLGSGKWIGIQYQSGSRLTFGIDDNVTKSTLDLGNPDIYFDDEWHNIVCMRDVAADKLRMFLDGVQVLEGSDNTGDISELAELVVGNCNYNFDTPFKGQMDELMIFDDALTSDEVEYLYKKRLVSLPETNIIQKAFTAYPNPFNGTITMKLPWEGSKAAEVQLIDMNGRVVYQRDFGMRSEQLVVDDMEQLHAGLYFCILRSENELFTTRLVKQ